MGMRVGPYNGLVLTGGGARGAYQVGVLKAIAEHLPDGGITPFPVVAGTSAGAINAAVAACFATDFKRGVHELERVWRGFRSRQVVRADAFTMLKSSLHWLATVVSGGVLVKMPRSLLDNQPLRELLTEQVPLDRIPAAIASGALHGIAVTASSYNAACSVSFFDGVDGLDVWARTRREGRRTRIEVEHLMASVSLPLVFPATRVEYEYFGDGALRQAAPLSPALHLGADRLLVIALRNERPDPRPTPDDPATYPTMGQIAGYLLDVLFTDPLYTDVERLRRINDTLEAVDRWHPEGEVALRSVELMVMAPSEDIREIAARHVHEMPRAMRTLLWGVGALNRGSMQLLSYLLFESGYTGELIDLGYRDGMARLPELFDFLGLGAGIISRS